VRSLREIGAAVAANTVNTADGVLPDTFRAALRVEFRRAVHPPYELPTVVLFNGLLVVLFWFSSFRATMFHLHGTLGLPVVLGAWMYSDVPATNVLGSDSRRMMLAVDDEDVVMRLLGARSTFLWLLVAPICVLIAAIIGIADDTALSAVYTILFVAIVPLGALAISDWIGIIWPYHPVSLKMRWQDRRQRRAQIRWLLLVVAPYMVVPAIFVVIGLPALGWWYYKTGGTVGRLGDSMVGQLTLIAAATSLAAWFGGRAVSRRLIRSRRIRLTSYLSEPQVG
jgi:hypothetical protein